MEAKQDACRDARQPRDRIRAAFYECGHPGCAAISVEEVVRYFMQLAETTRRSRGQANLGRLDKQAVALFVALMMQDMNVQRVGFIELPEWNHYMLLKRAGHVGQQVSSLLQYPHAKNGQVLYELLQVFEQADRSRSGELCLEDVAEMYRRKLWDIRPCPDDEDSERLSDDELNTGSPEDFARELIKVMSVEGGKSVSYAEFLAFCLGRRKSRVKLYMYDLSKGSAQKLLPWLVGKDVEGIWHTGVVVFGKEYYYARDTVFSDPGTTAFGDPDRVVDLGYTLWRQEELHEYVTRELKPLFQRDTYDVVSNNCNHFSDQLSMFLVGTHPPEEVMQQPDLLLMSRSVRTMRPVLNWYLRDRIVAREAAGSSPSAPSGPRIEAGEQVVTGQLVRIHQVAPGVPRPVLSVVCPPPETGCVPEGLQAQTVASSQGSVGASARAALLECGSASPGGSLLFGACSVSSGARDEAGPDEEGLEITGGVWVKHFDLSIGPNGALAGQVQTQLVPRLRLSSWSRRAVTTEAMYKRSQVAVMQQGDGGGGSPRPSLASRQCAKVAGEFDPLAAPPLFLSLSAMDRDKPATDEEGPDVPRQPPVASVLVKKQRAPSMELEASYIPVLGEAWQSPTDFCEVKKQRAPSMELEGSYLPVSGEPWQSPTDFCEVGDGSGDGTLSFGL